MWIKNKPQWLTPAPLKLAAICGHLEIVQRLMDASTEVWTSEAMDLAAMNGHLEVVKFLHQIENGPGCTTAAMDGASTYGHFEVVAFLNEKRAEGCTVKALQGAVYMGYPEIVEYLLNHRHEQFAPDIFFTSEFYRIQCHQAVEQKDCIGVLRFLSTYDMIIIDESIVLSAIKVAPLQTLKFVLDHNMYGITRRLFESLIEIDKSAARYALEVILAKNKPISILDHPVENIDPWTPLDDQLLLSRSRMPRSEWVNSTAMDIAAELGDFDTLKLLHRTGIKCCTIEAMNKAAAIGRLDILKWLHTHRTEGCSLDAITYASARGHRDVVQWLHDVQGLNCTKNGLNTAAYNGDVRMVKYLISIPMIENSDDFFSFGGLTFFSVCLLGNDPPFHVFCGNAVDLAASNGHIEIVDLLSDYPATTKAMDNAAINGHFEMVEYLHTRRSEGCTVEALAGAIRANRFDILKYLVSNNCYQGTIDFANLCVQAAGSNNLDMLTYCEDRVQGDVTNIVKQKMMYEAATRGHLEMVRRLHEKNGCGWTTFIQQAAAKRGHKRIVQYLNSIGECEDNELVLT